MSHQNICEPEIEVFGNNVKVNAGDDEPYATLFGLGICFILPLSMYDDLARMTIDFVDNPPINHEPINVEKWRDLRWFDFLEGRFRGYTRTIFWSMLALDKEYEKREEIRRQEIRLAI